VYEQITFSVQALITGAGRPASKYYTPGRIEVSQHIRDLTRRNGGNSTNNQFISGTESADSF
jgi:hypothetical protein